MEFFSSSEFPIGCNSSFIALIPKVQDAKNVNYFCSISLIKYIYNIVGKILANRLSFVIDKMFFFNEVLVWCTTKKHPTMFFKVDFEKPMTQFGGIF